MNPKNTARKITPKVNEIGNKHGKLTVLSLAGRDKGGCIIWLCLCECGKEKAIRGESLRSGNTTSCGCMAVQRGRNVGYGGTTHGACVNRQTKAEYRSYSDAKNRCNNPNNTQYNYYGGRGIKFLFISFEQFFAELGPKPKGLTLDRINTNGNYEPGNVRWATQSEQARNRRRPIKEKPNQSKYKGVEVIGKRFFAHINVNGKHKRLGGFATEIEAAKAYDEAALKYYGEFAVLNFPKEAK